MFGVQCSRPGILDSASVVNLHFIARPVMHRPPLSTHYSPLTTHCSLLTAQCSVLTAQCYSYRSESTGLFSAALIACVLTVSIAMKSARKPESRKIHHLISTR